METYQFLSNLRKYHNRRLILILITCFAFGFGNLYAQHVFSVSYNNLSQENTRQINTQIEKERASIAPMARNMSGEYAISISTDQNSRIILLNEETGNNVVITPTKHASAEFVLSPFFIEELRRATLSDAEQLLVMETGTDFSVRNVTSVSRTSEDVFIPRFFYRSEENVREALPPNRRIIHNP